MWFLHDPGLLGINARNLLYIKPYNPQKAIMMADSKIKTKNFLSARGIPVARLYSAISRKKDLDHFDFNSLPNTFVVKPNAGYGGEGILIIKGRKGVNFIDTGDHVVTLKQMKSHISDILDGRYSIADISDTALFEQRLEAPDFLKKMAFKGLPDIRVVVHNLIPVMAMLRLPTEVSGGKANIHMGGIGVGIDIAKGELTFATQFGKKIDSIPGYGDPKGFKIPQWEDFLLIAARVQQATNLGFAAVDLVLDRNMGPALLEINARAGLQVQVANMAPLRRRLERIQGVKVTSPEKGVRIATELFGTKIESREDQIAGKTVVGTMERLEVIGRKDTARIIAKMDPGIEKSLLDRKTAERIGLESSGKCKFSLMDQKVTTVVDVQDLGGKPYQMLVGQRDLRDFLIDPNKNVAALNEDFVKKPVHIAPVFTAKDLERIDEELADIDSHIKLLSHLKPVNLAEENFQFLNDPNYNPRFKYKELAFDPQNFYTRLRRLEFPDSPIGILWKKKADEIVRKIRLLEARDSSEFTQRSVELYGPLEDELFEVALNEIRGMPADFPKGGKVLSAKEAKKIFEKAIADCGLKGWRVKLKEDLVSDAIAGKENVLFIRTGALFSEDRLKGTIAHEIETHAFTAMNGALQPYKIFQRGLADYLATEEGLAVYNQELTESGETIKKFWPASSVVGIHEAVRGSFTDVYHKVLELGFGAERAWRVALKAKRGLGDTAKPGAFTKDWVYFKGVRMVRSFVAGGGDLRDLYYGKINLDDLETVKKVKGLKTPLYLPAYLRK